MELLQILEKRSIAGFSLSDLKTILSGYSEKGKVIVHEPQCIVLDNAKTIGCVAKYYKPKGEERIRPKSNLMHMCINTRRKMISNEYAKCNMNCIECHIKCIELLREGLLERI